MSTLTDQRFPSIDYHFQPRSYWGDEPDPLAAVLRDVKGTNRRQMIRDFWVAGKFDQLQPELLEPEISDRSRELLGSFHPSFMGGEYLPAYLPLETEIARIELRSTTSDVISIRARPAGEGVIRYRIVDEYDSAFNCTPSETRKPLALEELVHLIDHVDQDSWNQPASLALIYNEGNLGGTSTPEDLRHFTTVSSDVYPELLDHYDDLHERWVASVERKGAAR